MYNGVISVENTALSSQVLFEDFVGFSDDIIKKYHLKTKEHLSLNKDVWRYFSDYEKTITDAMTIREPNTFSLLLP